jgi:hypothetical protein
MDLYYDWRTDSYRMVPAYRNVAPTWLMGNRTQNAPAPASVINAAANSTPVQLMQKFVNSRGWGEGNNDQWTSIANLMRG